MHLPLAAIWVPEPDPSGSGPVARRGGRNLFGTPDRVLMCAPASLLAAPAPPLSIPGPGLRNGFLPGPIVDSGADSPALAFRVVAAPGLRARPSPGPDSGLDGPGCLSAGLVPLAVQWPPAHAVVWPFGWRTLGVSGHGGRAVRRTPGPYTGRIEGPRARCTPDRSSSPAGVITQP